MHEIKDEENRVVLECSNTEYEHLVDVLTRKLGHQPTMVEMAKFVKSGEFNRIDG